MTFSAVLRIVLLFFSLYCILHSWLINWLAQDIEIETDATELNAVPRLCTIMRIWQDRLRKFLPPRDR